ncbi:MAG: DNA primase [Candidatus Kerfeldbacteria bacterium]|nr:DNA primase [Candidatus Kerfeldbacteria bacterium]
MVISFSPVDEIKERLDIAEVLGEYVQLKPAGTNRYKVLCPFHNEKTPSLMVSKDRQAWHCFGCGKGGDMFSFVQEIENVDFPEALRLLAKKANIELRPIDPQLHDAKTRLLDLVRLAAAFYRKVLTDAASAETARTYLRQRGVSDETAENFILGYSPTTWDGLLSFVLKKGFTEQEAFEAGLTVKRERGIGSYDRFRGRLMFPIRDVNGTVVGFGGRIVEAVEGDVGSTAKYINTPETLVYSKSRVLFGLDRAKRAIKQADLAILVEGYLDCLTSHQAGVANVVAVSGTALTNSQVKMLKRYTNNLALAFDADLAGGEAARRGIDQALAADLRVTIITLPDAKDPDELIRRDPNRWRNAIATAERIVDYSFNRAFAAADPTDVDGKKRIAQQLLPVVARLTDPVEQSHYLKELSARLGVDEQALRDALRRRRPGQRPTPPPSTGESPLTLADRATVVAERILALGLFTRPELFSYLTELIDTAMLPDPELQALYRQALLYYSEVQQLDHEGFRKYLAKELPLLTNRVAKVMLLAEQDFSSSEASAGDDAARLAWLRQEIGHGSRLLRRERVVNELRRLEHELRQAEAAHATAHADALLKQLNQLTDELHALEA